MRATLEDDESRFQTSTRVDLIFSTILDLKHDAYYQTGLALSEMEQKIADGAKGQLEFNLLIHTHKCFYCDE